MSYDTLLYVWDAFSSLLFLVILLSSLQNKNQFKENKYLIITSLSLFIGMFLFYREQYLLFLGETSVLLTFFTYTFSSFSLMLMATLIVTLYTKVVLPVSVNLIILAYGIIVGVIMSINVFYGTYLSTHILIGIIYAIPIIHLIIYVVKYNKSFYKNVFFLQSVALLVVYIAKTLNLMSNYESITFQTANYHEIGFLMIGNIIIFSFIISYLNIRNDMINNELRVHKSLIEDSLTQAITLSEMDPLTEVYNRRKINEIIQHYFDYEEFSNTIFSVILIDINQFKKINDTYGHNVGDKVLKFISINMKRLLREVDYISRWGGDEFLILLPNTSKENAEIVASKIKRYFTNNKCESINEPIAMSCGITDSLHHNSLEAIIEHADELMYNEK